MKQNKILNTIATIAMALAIAIMSAQAAGAVTLANIEFPNDIALDSGGNIYVADDSNRSVMIFNSIGVLRQTVGSGLLNSPDSVAVDSAGNIYVADRDPLILTNNRIVIFNSAGSFLRQVGSDLLISSDGVALDSA